jgi:uncharacterized protein YrrD
MRKGKSVIGKALLSLEDGTRLEKVNDLIVDPGGQHLVGLLVDEGGLMSSARVVPISEVSSFGKDAVVVRGPWSIVAASDDEALRAMVEQEDKILGKEVYTVLGDDQGSIADIYFDEPTGTVMGYEVSNGLLGDAAKGTSYLAADDVTIIGSDLIYVQPDTAANLDQQVGGIQGAMRDAGDRIGEASGALKERARQTTDAASRGEGPGGEPLPAGSLVGRRTGSDVESDSGSVIVPRGRRVRSEDVDAAREAGQLEALAASVTLGEAEDARAGAKDALGAAGDSAANLWDRFTAKIGEMTDATGKRADEEMTKRRLADISDAIGRPVTKVILDREDNVILNLGDIITHSAVQRAHEAGGLDSLLASVYKGSIEFTKDEMRAPDEVEAEATVDKASGGAAVVEELEQKVETAERERQAEAERKKAEDERQREIRRQERENKRSEREREASQREEVTTKSG